MNLDTHIHIHTHMENPMFFDIYIYKFMLRHFYSCVYHVYIEDLDCYLFLVFLSNEYTECFTICVLSVNSKFLKIFVNKNSNTKILSLNRKHL